MSKRKLLLIIFILLPLLFLSSCVNDSGNIEPKPTETEMLLQSIGELELKLINIMAQVDLIPYYEKQIANKKRQEAENRQTEILMGAVQKEEEAEETDTKEKEFTPEPITDKDILLLKLLEEEELSFREIEEEVGEKIPEDMVFIWAEINDEINELHFTWSGLKPQLQKTISIAEAVSKFDNVLNSLTISSNENNFFKTLVLANELTLYIAQFYAGLKQDVYGSLYTLKYYTRQLVLTAADNNYSEVSANLEAIKREGALISAALNKEKSENLPDNLDIAIADLETAVKIKDLNVIKIKASILIKNINLVRNKLIS